MIQVNVLQSNEENRVLQITVLGHAEFSEPGQDVVCAAVSALTIGALNSTETLLGIDLQPISDEKDGGVLSWAVPRIDDPIVDDQLQLLMKALVGSLKMIEEDYHDFIQVNL
ncbi:ribosomal-processing cysteine protease Prp [Tepidibacillus marianensis]|uniref:ribosomal-processing cysteine protease Prp n=1 Tax=Tepidibacillus marianensis TaxID=3131995 RepID=UPI0030CAA941